MLKAIKVTLPEETLLAIEKAVRHRGREGYYGQDYSNIASLEHDFETSLRKQHLDALVNGHNIYKVPYQSKPLSKDLFDRVSIQ